MDILFTEVPGQKGHLGQILLNRPQALNALTHEMIVNLDQQLTLWAHDPKIKAVIIRSSNERAFCAGGDLRQIYQAWQAGEKTLERFFQDEYRLNHRIFHYPKPYIALLDGITMGGGAGISIHGSHRVVTEKMIFAMPETGIGFFPDIGSSYFLARCPGEIGVYLGLTGARIQAADAIHIGIAESCVPHHRLDELVQALAESPFTKDPRESVTQILQIYTVDAGIAPLIELREIIEDSFSAERVETIFECLQTSHHAWAQSTLRHLLGKSLTSLKVTLQQIRMGAHLDFDECIQLDARIAQSFLTSHDFYEGIRALLIDKDQKPRWQPHRLEDVTESMVSAYFDLLKNKNV